MRQHLCFLEMDMSNSRLITVFHMMCKTYQGEQRQIFSNRNIETQYSALFPTLKRKKSKTNFHLISPEFTKFPCSAFIQSINTALCSTFWISLAMWLNGFHRTGSKNTGMVVLLTCLLLLTCLPGVWQDMEANMYNNKHGILISWVVDPKFAM